MHCRGQFRALKSVVWGRSKERTHPAATRSPSPLRHAFISPVWDKSHSGPQDFFGKLALVSLDQS